MKFMGDAYDENHTYFNDNEMMLIVTHLSLIKYLWNIDWIQLLKETSL